MRWNVVELRILTIVSVLALFSGMAQAQFAKYRSGPKAERPSGSTLNQNIITGTDTGADNVRRFDTPSLTATANFLAYAGFTGGARVASGDVNGDGIADIITGAGPGGGPHVKVFDGGTLAEIRSFFAYPAGFTGGIFVAAGDVNGDGRADIITGTDSDPATPAHVKVFDAATGAEIRSFLPFAGFTGGVRVAAGKVNSDGIADIVVGSGPGAGQVKVFNGLSSAEIANFLAYGPAYAGGVYVAAGDLNVDLRDDIVTGTDAGTPAQVKVFDAATLAELRSFLPFGATFTGGARVAAGRVNPDTIADLVVGTGPNAPSGTPPVVQAYDGATNTLIHSFFPYAATFIGGVFVAAPPILQPSAAAVSVSGRVMTPDGRGLRNAYVFLTDQKGVSRRVLTSSLGYYRFDDVPAGETYVIGVSSKLYRFAPRLVTVSDELTGVDFIGLD